MISIVSKPDTHEKLEILSSDAQYDLACACGSTKDEHRRRGVYLAAVHDRNGPDALYQTLPMSVASKSRAVRSSKMGSTQTDDG